LPDDRQTVLTRHLPILLITVCLAGCGGSSPAAGQRPPATGSTVTVDIPGADRFTPPVVEVVKGSRVTFTNHDGDPHTATSVPGDPTSFALTLPPGASASVVVDRTGVYRYFCALHARYDPSTGQIAALPNADHPAEPMAGTVVVTTGP
jgi:plastocyanin